MFTGWIEVIIKSAVEGRQGRSTAVVYSSLSVAKPPAAFRLKGMAKTQIMRERANERGDNATAGRRKTLVRESAPKR